jgi:hypothetical protein
VDFLGDEFATRSSGGGGVVSYLELLPQPERLLMKDVKLQRIMRTLITLLLITRSMFHEFVERGAGIIQLRTIARLFPTSPCFVY